MNIIRKSGKYVNSGEIMGIARNNLPGLVRSSSGQGRVISSTAGFEDWITGHTVLQLAGFFASGTYFFNRSERDTTVTELAAIARAASSGLNVIPNDG